MQLTLDANVYMNTYRSADSRTCVTPFEDGVSYEVTLTRVASTLGTIFDVARIVSFRGVGTHAIGNFCAYA